jgi:catalase-peroxidase
MAMSESMSWRRLLVLAISALPVTSAVSCPYVRGNDLSPPPENILKPRYSPEGPNFGQCPRKSQVAGGGTRSQQWWPCELNLAVLRQNADKSIPLDVDFDYASEFAKLDGREFHWIGRFALQMLTPGSGPT